MLKVIKLYAIVWAACAVTGAVVSLLLMAIFGAIATEVTCFVCAGVGAIVALLVAKTAYVAIFEDIM